MGACFSSSSASPPPTAKVVSLKGDLREYPTPVSVSQVVESDSFVCNSDFLSYDEPIPALRSDALLLPNQLYFLLPASKLGSRLTAADMAALAVTASQALLRSAAGGRKKSSIAPLFFLLDGHDSNLTVGDNNSSSRAKPLPRSGSIRKLQRYASRRAKLAVRSFRLRLATVYEGTVL
ncbi:unnamed protein product [Linum tenue]|uniref:Uncharacterized protein n=1 Tax=Linum tenue TaxID=586396 RepID=A0AAV0IMP2_9ROSI|nr:unnamed protein product [Linum tenue]CAI0398852.1 unnamed protein product [Linum tenue]